MTTKSGANSDRIPRSDSKAAVRSGGRDFLTAGVAGVFELFLAAVGMVFAILTVRPLQLEFWKGGAVVVLVEGEQSVLVDQRMRSDQEVCKDAPGSLKILPAPAS
jgi:hypothetical protein